MNKRQRKKAEKKALALAWRALVLFRPEPNMPTDDDIVRGPHYAFLD